LKLQIAALAFRQNKQADLFGAFTQVDSSTTRTYGGTGLGLAIAKQLAELMSGSISVKSEEGKGASFFFTFKTRTGSEPAFVSPEQNLADITDKKILVVDDNEKHLNIICSQLRHINLIPVIATSGLEALKLLQADKNFDMVITDLWMPEMDGIELAKNIKNLYPQMPVVLISALKDMHLSEHESLFRTILSKPIKHQLLHTVISNELNKNAAAPEVSKKKQAFN